MALMNQAAFRLFLERWHDDDPRAGAIQAFLPAESQECRAVGFLLDPRPLADKRGDSRYALNAEESFWQFILAELYQKNGALMEAQTAYRQCIQRAQDGDPWWVSVAHARLQELK
jgi:hypothetical protein